MTDKLKEAIEWLKEIRDLFMPKTRNAIDTVVAVVEQKSYTSTEIEAFAEWIGNNKYYVPFYNPMSDSIVWAKGGTRDGYIITAQLRELWEKERGEK